MERQAEEGGDTAQERQVNDVEKDSEVCETSMEQNRDPWKLSAYCEAGGSTEKSSSGSDNSGGPRKSQRSRERSKAGGSNSKASEECTEDSLSASSESESRKSPVGSSKQSADSGKQASAPSRDDSQPPSRSSGSESETDSLGNRPWVYHYRCPAHDIVEEPAPVHRKKKQKLDVYESRSGLEAGDRTEKLSAASQRGDSPSACTSNSSPESHLSSDSLSQMQQSALGSDEDVYVDLMRCIVEDDHAALKRLIASLVELCPQISLRFHIKFQVEDTKKTCFLGGGSLLHFAVACGSMACASEIVLAWPATLMQECSMLWLTAEVKLATAADLSRAVSKEFGESTAETNQKAAAFFLQFASHLNTLCEIAAVRREQNDHIAKEALDAQFQAKIAELLTNPFQSPEDKMLSCVFAGGYVDNRVDSFRKVPCTTGFNVTYVTSETRVYVEDKRHTPAKKFEFAIVG